MMFNKCMLAWSAISLAPHVTLAQITSYDDVAVIVNTNSAVSRAIGEYFRVARNIPEVNMIMVDAPLTETIDFEQFNGLRPQIEEHLVSNALIGTINYLVTTKGFPLRIEVSDCDTLNQFSKCSSVDSELALLLGPYATGILGIGSVLNPFANSSVHHSHTESGIFLVTRLDGYTEAEVIALIDRSGPDRPVVQNTAWLVGDVSNAPQTLFTSFFNSQLEAVFAPLNGAGWNSQIDTTDAVLSGIPDVIARVDIDYTPTGPVPDLIWSAGALAFDWFSNSAASFSETTTDPMEVRVAEMIRSGATGARGAVSPIYSGPNTLVLNTIEQYLDTAAHFDLAESFYAGIPSLSWAYQVIGDPKTSIKLVSSTSISEGAHWSSLVFPNPSIGNFAVRISEGRTSITGITDATGRFVAFEALPMPNGCSVDLGAVANGIYFVHLRESPRALRVVVQR